MSGDPEHTNLRRQVTRAMQAERNMHWQVIAKETERAAVIGDTWKLYQLVIQSSRRAPPSNELLLARSGEVIANLEGHLARWETIFRSSSTMHSQLQAPTHHL